MTDRDGLITFFYVETCAKVARPRPEKRSVHKVSGLFQESGAPAEDDLSKPIATLGAMGMQKRNGAWSRKAESD